MSRLFGKSVGPHPRKTSRARAIFAVALCLALPGFISAVRAQTAVIDDAWWTYQQDCNGDGLIAGTLPGDRARLNWNPDVTNCNGGLTVTEIVYSKPCGSNTWTALYTNNPHSITGCRSSDGQYVDVAMGSNGICRDYRIEIYRTGQSTPDYIRSATNDVDLAQHREQLLAQDFCLSDSFATCAALGGSQGSRSDQNVTATKEPGEPNHAGNTGGKSLWYCWTATTNTSVTFDTIGSSFDTLLAVYTGTSVSNLTLVASNDDITGWTNRQSAVTFLPTPGTTYHIAVDGFGGAAGGVVLNWNQSTRALPDLIVWGPAVSPSVVTRTFATNDCEVVEGCETPGLHTLLSFNTETRNIGAGDLVMGDPLTNSLFHYASCHGHYHFEEFFNYDLLDTNGNAVAQGHKVGFCLLDDHAWSPTASPTAKYNCNYQGIQSGWADVYTAGLPCQYIDITGVPPGDYVLRMNVNPAGLIEESNTNNNLAFIPVTIPPPTCPSAPPNDNFANAMTVTATPFSYSEFTQCATKQPGEPNHAGNAGGHSIWFAWTPTNNQTAVLTTKGSDYDTMLGVYAGTSVSALSLVASNDDIVYGIIKTSQLSFPAIAGTTYHIAVDGYNNNDGGAVGNAVLNINPPGNDDFTNAYVLTGASGATNGSNFGASKQPYEPAHAYDVGGHSIWYKWTAPISGPVDINTAGSSFDTTLAVYTGGIIDQNGSLTNLTVVAANHTDPQIIGASSSRVDFDAVAGMAYKIAVDGYAGAWGNVSLHWNMLSQMGIAGLPAEKAQVSFTGVGWRRYGILVSTNLKSWSTQTAMTMSGPSQQYIDDASVTTQRFYRTVLLP